MALKLHSSSCPSVPARKSATRAAMDVEIGKRKSAAGELGIAFSRQHHVGISARVLNDGDLGNPCVATRHGEPEGKYRGRETIMQRDRQRAARSFTQGRDVIRAGLPDDGAQQIGTAGCQELVV